MSMEINGTFSFKFNVSRSDLVLILKACATKDQRMFDLIDPMTKEADSRELYVFTLTGRQVGDLKRILLRYAKDGEGYMRAEHAIELANKMVEQIKKIKVNLMRDFDKEGNV